MGPINLYSILCFIPTLAMHYHEFSMNPVIWLLSAFQHVYIIYHYKLHNASARLAAQLPAERPPAASLQSLQTCVGSQRLKTRNRSLT